MYCVVDTEKPLKNGHLGTKGSWSDLRGGRNRQIHSNTQGVYNCLLLVPIVGGARFQCHQLAAVFNASFSVFQMTYEISRINRMGEEGDFCDAMTTYP